VPAASPHRRRRRRRRPPRPVAAAPHETAGDAAPRDAGDALAEAGAEPAAAEPERRLPGPNTLRLPRRRRRRVRRPAAIAAAAGGEAAPATGDAPPPTTGAASAAAPRLGPDGQPLPARPRRRRRRRPPQLGGAGDNAAAPAPAGRDGEARPARRAGGGFRRPRRPEAGGGAPEARDQRPEGERQRGPRRDGRPERGNRGDRREGRGRGPGRAEGRGRDDRAKRVERKLYTFDSVVDRGFEDVEEESGTRRVHWTIVKRTVADQITRKAVSQNYVLQRDGSDSEFPTLGAARDTVNKKIVHPEKLTLSKAEHAAAKSNSR